MREELFTLPLNGADIKQMIESLFVAQEKQKERTQFNPSQERENAKFHLFESICERLESTMNTTFVRNFFNMHFQRKPPEQCRP